jgi:hypothetical protein
MVASPLVAKAALDANANVSVDVTPVGSQQLVIVSALLSGLCLTVGFFFLWHLHPFWGVPIGAGVLLGAATFWAHSRSRQALDRATAGVTEVSTDGNGVSVRTNALTLGDGAAADALNQLVAILLYRESLPAPDGLVRPDQTVDVSADALKQAHQRVLTANFEAEDLQRSALNEIAGKHLPTTALPAIGAPSTLPPSGLNVAAAGGPPPISATCRG